MTPRKVLILLAYVFLAVFAVSQRGSATNLRSAASALQGAPAQSQVRLENGSILYAELTKTVDAKKAKAGDPVNAVLLSDVVARGKIVVRHEAKLLGHVTEAQVHSKETPESRLGIVFDKVITKEGEVPFESKLLAIRPAEHPAFDVPQAPSPGSNAAQQSMQRQYPSPQGSNVPRRPNPSLSDQMKSRDREIAQTGPTDIDGLSLSSPKDGAQAVVSTQRTVKLESGVKIELRVTSQ
ncbi:MAG: hypothetical protein LAO76_20400 [Acidobacteriia bacterium]|nr:hypothetical protein [Terriglobia bacterium]